MKQQTVWSRALAWVMTLMMLGGMVMPAALAGDQAQFSMEGVPVVTAEGNPIPQSDKLEDFIVINKAIWNLPSGDPITIYPGQKFGFHLEFKEGSNLEFDRSKTQYIYTFPNGMKPVGLNGVSGWVLGEPASLGNNVTVTPRMMYSVNETDGTIIVTFDENDDETKQFLQLAQDRKIIINGEYTFAQTSGQSQIQLPGGATITVHPQPSSLAVKKEGTYNRWDIQVQGNKWVIPYQVVVESKGTNTDVTVTDTFKKDLLPGVAYQVGSLEVMSQKDGNVTSSCTATPNESGVTFKLPDISHGDVYTLKYNLCIPYDESQAGKDLSIEIDNFNKVTWSSKEDQDNGTRFSSTKLEINKLNTYNWLNKSGAQVAGNNGIYIDSDGTRYQLINWTLEVNKDCNICLNGKTITDTIQPQTPPMEYHGDGITLEDGTSIPWDELTSKNDTSFTYTFSDHAGEKKAHTITYQTRVPLDQFHNNVQFSNKVEGPGGGSSTGSVGIQGEGTNPFAGVKLEKTFLKRDDYNTLEWELKVTVPAQSIEVVINDTVPNVSNNYPEDIIDNTITIAPTSLNPNETPQISFAISPYNQTCQTITITDLAPDPNAKPGDLRTIILTYKTRINKAWLETVNEETHENKASGTFRLQDKSTGNIPEGKAETEIPYYTFSKTTEWGHNHNGMDFEYENGFKLPKFAFTIVLGKFKADHVTITETFDTKLFKMVGAEVVCGTDEWWYDHDNPITPQVIPTATGCKIEVTGLPADKTHYQIQYYLRVIDKPAYEKLLRLAKNGTFNIQNNARIEEDEREASADYPFTITPINKTLLQAASADKQYVAKFQLVVNPDGLMLNTVPGTDLEVVDTMTNLRLMEGSLTVTYDGASHEVPYYTEGNDLHIFVPDGKPVTITYEARVIGDGETNVPYSNKAIVIGYRNGSVVNQTVNMNVEASVSGSQTHIYVKKVNAYDERQTIPGVTFQLYEVDNKKTPAELTKKREYTTGDDGTVMIPSEGEQLTAWDSTPAGGGEQAQISYKLVETRVPEGSGYVLDPTPIEFAIYKDAKDMQSTKAYFNGATIKVKNEKVSAKILKVNEAEQPLAGAGLTLAVNTADRKEVATWFSSTGPKAFEISDNPGKGQLAPNTEYVLTETSAPDGYKRFEGEVTFTVDENGVITLTGTKPDEAELKNGVLILKNTPEPTQISFQKVDADTDDGLVGAQLTLYRVNTSVTPNTRGEEVESWQTDGTLHTITDGLADGTYCLVETAFPTGYGPYPGATTTTPGAATDGTTAPTSPDYSVTFTVVGGKITAITENADRAELTPEGLLLCLKNKEQTTTRPALSFAKVDSTNTTIVPSGAGFELYKVENDQKVGSALHTWNTDTAPYNAKPYTISEGLDAGTYRLIETTFPSGYVALDNDHNYVDFTVDADGKIVHFTSTSFAEVSAKCLTLTVKNTPCPKIGFKKVDASNPTQTVSGATFELHKDTASGTLVASWNTATDNPKQLQVQPGDYCLVETVFPNGYVADSTKNTVTFTVDATGNITISPTVAYASVTTNNQIAVLTVKNTPLPKPKLSFLKVDGDNPTEALVGAQLTLYKVNQSASGTTKAEIDQWETTKVEHTLTNGLDNGTYRLAETTFPTGYGPYPDASGAIASKNNYSVTFTVQDGKITGIATADQNRAVVENTQLLLRLKNKKETPVLPKLSFEKVDSVTGNAVSGAELKLYKLNASNQIDGIALYSWTSGTAPYEIAAGLPAGDYRLTETHFPDDYIEDYANNRVDFTVNAAGEIESIKTGKDHAEINDNGLTLTVKNTPNTPTLPVLSFAKVDSVTGAAVIGAKLELRENNAAGKVIEPSWITDGQPHTLLNGLAAGTYCLIETQFPTGYKADTANNSVTFTVNADGRIANITAGGDHAQISTDRLTLTVKNTRLHKIGFKKVNKNNPNVCVPSAELELRKGGINGESLGKWVTKDKAYILEDGLEAGTYCLVETGFPDGYVVDTLHSYVIFTVNAQGKVTLGTLAGEDYADLTEENGVAILRLKNEPLPEIGIQKVDEVGNLLSGAKLQLYKVKADGTLGDKCGPSWTSQSNGTHKMEGGLKAGTYCLVEEAFPVGYAEYPSSDTKNGGNRVTFTVNAKGKFESILYGKDRAAITDGGMTLRVKNLRETRSITTPTPVVTATPVRTPVPTPTPGPEFISIPITKLWQDESDAELLRPDSVTIELQSRVAGGDYQTVRTVQFAGIGDTWTYTFEDMPTRDENGREYQYRVREEPVDGYAVEYDGYTITNTHIVVTPTPEITPLPTPRFVGPKPERAVGMKYQDGEWIWIDDLGVPLGVVAQTGDNDNLPAVLGSMAMLLVIACMLVFMIIRKKKR